MVWCRVRPQQDDQHSADNMFNCIFLKGSVCILIFKSPLIFILCGLIHASVNIGPGNGLALSRWQAITSTNNKVLQYSMASLGHNGLKPNSPQTEFPSEEEAYILISNLALYSCPGIAPK